MFPPFKLDRKHYTRSTGNHKLFKILEHVIFVFLFKGDGGEFENEKRIRKKEREIIYEGWIVKKNINESRGKPFQN